MYRTRGVAVKTMSFTESRNNFAKTLDAVVNDAEPVVITRAGHEPVVIVSKRDYESLVETATCCAARPTPAGCSRRSPAWRPVAGPSGNWPMNEDRLG